MAKLIRGDHNVCATHQRMVEVISNSRINNNLHVYKRRRMLLWCNVWVLVACHAMNICGPAQTFGSEDLRQHDSGGLARPDSVPSPIEAPLLDWSHAQQVFRLIESWVWDGRVHDEDGPPLLVSDLSAVHVTLRWLGKTVGDGQAAIEPDAPMGRAVDLTELVRKAVAKALESLRVTLDDRRRRALTGGEMHENQKQMTLAKVGPRLSVDLQLARRPETLVIGVEAPPDEVFRRFSPGYHGLTLTSARGPTGSASSVWLWPASVLARNVQPRSQLLQLLSAAGVRSPEQTTSLGRTANPTFARFEVIHLVRPARNASVTSLVRGNLLLPTRSVDGPTLDALSQRISQFLQQRLRDDGSMAGTYWPTSDRYDPPRATAQDMALSAYAWTRRAAYLAQSSRDSQAGQAERAACNQVFQHLCGRLLRDGDEFHPSTAALLIVTLAESADLIDHKAERDALTRQMLELRSADGSFRSSPRDDAPRLNLPTQALIVLALASLHEQTRDVKLGAMLAQSQRWLWQQLTTSRLIETLPWLALAEFRFSSLSAVDPKSGPSRAAKVRAFESVMDALLGVQMTETPELGPADVIGGFELGHLSGRDANGSSQIGWRTAQILVFLAAALRQDELTPEDRRTSRLLACGLAARFLGQLMVDEPSAFYMRSISDVLGGLRLSLWDNRLSVGPAAMALLATSELQEAIAQLNLEGLRSASGR